MAYPRTPGGLFPLTTAPTGRNAGGQYPLSAVLSDAIRSLAPTAYWKLDEASGNLADAMSGGYTATVTGSPTYGVAAPSPIAKGITFSGTGQYAATSTSITTPTASVSVLAVYWTSDATAATRYLAGRRATSQFTWDLRMSSSHSIQFVALQSSGSTHATVQASGSASNDGLPHLALGTFDGTTIRCARDDLAAGSSTTLTGSWHLASTSAISIASGSASGVGLYPGTLAHVAYWADRVITDAERLWLNSIVRGG